MLILLFVFLKPWLFVRGQFLGTVRKIAIVSKLTLTIRRIVCAKDSLDDVSLSFEHIRAAHVAHAAHATHTGAGHPWLFGAELGGTVRVVAVVPVVAVAFFKDVFAHGGLVVSRPRPVAHVGLAHHVRLAHHVGLGHGTTTT